MAGQPVHSQSIVETGSYLLHTTSDALGYFVSKEVFVASVTSIPVPTVCPALLFVLSDIALFVVVVVSESVLSVLSVELSPQDVVITAHAATTNQFRYFIL